MRELKFRACIEINGEPLLTYSSDIGLIAFFRKFEYGKNIEQYTGLKDKNGKEIYEGDIVKMPEWQVKPRYEAVKYYKAGFDPFQEGCRECWSPDGDEVEVVGNIHENAELLGEEE